MYKRQVYDRLIEENDFGRFANSFLIIASKDGRQEKTIFAKYNRTRKEEFRIRTTMGELDGERRVEKAALESAGRYHILSLKNKCRQLRQLNPCLLYTSRMRGIKGPRHGNGWSAGS